MYAPLGMRLLWKYIRNYFLVYQLISRFLLYLQNYKEFEAEILELQSEKYGLSFDIKKYTTSGWALGDENVIGIRAFKIYYQKFIKFAISSLCLSKYLLTKMTRLHRLVKCLQFVWACNGPLVLSFTKHVPPPHKKNLTTQTFYFLLSCLRWQGRTVAMSYLMGNFCF